MKKAFFSLLFLVPIMSVFAQSNAGYRAASTRYSFDTSKTNIPMEGYYILKDGTQVDAIIAYGKPEFFIGDFAAGASLVICKSLTNKPMDVFNPDSEPNFKEYIKKDDIKGFFIDGHLYGNVPNTGWRIVLTEGAIRSFINVIKVETNSGIKYMSFEQSQKLGGEAYGSLTGGASKDRLTEMIADAPSIAESVKNGSRNVYQAVLDYNKWYDANNPGKIDYILGVNGLNKEQDAAAAKMKAEEQKVADEKQEIAKSRQETADYNKMINDAKSKASNAPKRSYYDGRPATAAAAIASSKPEVKVKKQKFMARINRIKAEGNKVAVVVWCSNVVVLQNQTFSTREVVPIYGSFGPLEGYEKWGEMVTEKLNKAFSTDVFENVDYKQIPTKEVDGKQKDDWWSTKYKMILEYNFRPYYDVYLESSSDSTNTTKTFKAQLKVDFSSLLSAAEDGAQNRLKSAGSPPKAFSYSSKIYTGEESAVVHTIQELQELVGAPSGAEIVDIIIKNNEANLDKFIKKKSKK